jgi:5-methylcytosine-specific restriction endonuclease McrA
MTVMPRPKEVLHDETPSIVKDHKFEPRGEWWTLCKHCHLAESAHAETTRRFQYYSDDLTEDI